MNLADRIITLRKQKGLSQTDLVKAAVGEGINDSFDKKSLSRLQDIEKLDADTKEKIYFVIDNIIQNVNAKKAFAS